MPIVAVELLVIGLLVVVLVAALAWLARLIAHGEEGASITEAQARENAAPLTRAILALNSREHTGRDQSPRRQSGPKRS